MSINNTPQAEASFNGRSLGTATNIRIGDARPRRSPDWQGDDGTGSAILNPRVVSPVSRIKQAAEKGLPVPMPGSLNVPEGECLDPEVVHHKCAKQRYGKSNLPK